MISESKANRWIDLINAPDSAVEFEIGMGSGAIWKTVPPYPELEALEVQDLHVRRTVLQQATIKATDPDTGDDCIIIVSRLVAELENGIEVEISRAAKRAEGDEIAYPDNICAACDLEIVDASETEHYDGKAYHKRCMS